MPKLPYQARYRIELPQGGIASISEAKLILHLSSHRFHEHAEFQILCVISGQMVVTSETTEVTLSPGDLCILPPRFRHRVGPSRHEDLATILDIRIVDQRDVLLSCAAKNLKPMALYSLTPERMERRRSELYLARDQAGSGQLASVMATLWRMLAACHEGATPVVSTDQRITQAESYIREHVSQSLSVKQIARRAGLSRSQLSRLFFTHRQSSPARRIRELKIEWARSLLDETNLSIKEVASACGFARANHFTRIFQEFSGCAPSEYRQRAGED